MNKTHLLHFLATAAALLGSLSFAYAQDPTSTIGIKLGVTRNYVNSTTPTYYDFSYYGKSLLTNGSQPTFGDYATGGLADVTSKPFFFSVDRGQSQVGGSLLQAYNVKPISSFIKGLKDWDFVFGVDAQVQTLTQSNYQFGAEYKALSVPMPRVGGVPVADDFLRLGMSFERHIDNAGNQVDDGTLTARGALAIAAFVWSPSSRKASFSDHDFAIILDYATMTDIRDNFMPKHNMNAVGYSSRGRTIADGDTNNFAKMNNRFKLLKDGWDASKLPEGTRIDRWNAARFDDFPEPAGTPDVVVWADGNADWAFTTEAPAAKFRSIYSLNVKFNLNDKATSYLQVQFQNGFTIAEPTSRVNSLVAFLGYSF